MPKRPDDKAAMAAIRDQLQSKDFVQALHESSLLLRHNTAIPELWSLHAQSLQGLGKFTEAEACYERGLAACGQAPRLLVQLGHLLSRQNRADEACDYYTRAMSIDPTLTDAYRGLLNFRAIPLDSAEVATLLNLALDAGRSDAARARALFLLGQIYTDSGLDNPGFAFYQQANRFASRGLQGTREYQVSPNAAAMDARFFQRHPRQHAVHNSRLVVVAGLPRSGKSLVETLLSRSPEVAAGGELALVRKLAASLPPRDNLEAFAAALAADSGSTLLDSYQPLADPETRYLTDTSPANLSRLGWLGLLHPEVPVIFCKRTPLDLGLALFFKNFRSGHRYSYQLATVGRAIAVTEKLIAHWQAALPNPTIEVQYEELVRDPERLLGELNTLLGLRGDASESALNAPSWRIFPSRSLDAVGGISPSLIGFANRFRLQLAPLMQAYDDEMARPRLSSPPEAQGHGRRGRNRSATR